MLFSLHSTFQIILALASASTLHVLTANHVFLKFLSFLDLTAHEVPTDEELRQIANPSGEPHRRRHRPKRGMDYRDIVFHIPAANLDLLELKPYLMTTHDLIITHSSSELEWIVDLSMLGVANVIITELFFFFLPNPAEAKFSALWPFLVVVYSTRILGKMTIEYIKNEVTVGGRYICLWAMGGFLVLSMFFVTVDEAVMEFDLIDAYRSIYASFSAAFTGEDMPQDLGPRPPHVPFTMTTTKFLISVVATIYGVIFTFPGIRCGQLYQVLIDEPHTSADSLVINFYYLAPLLFTSLWVKPLTRAFLTNQAFSCLDDNDFNITRIYTGVFINIGRFLLVGRFLNGFLRSAHTRLAKLKRRGGHTTNKAVKYCVSSTNNYVNITTLHYVLPLIICFFSVMMFKILGSYKWWPLIFRDRTILDEFASPNGTTPEPYNWKYWKPLVFAANLKKKKDPPIVPFADILDDYNGIRNLFTTQFMRGFTGYFCWWLHFAWFSTTSAGALYFLRFGRYP